MRRTDQARCRSG